MGNNFKGWSKEDVERLLNNQPVKRDAIRPDDAAKIYIEGGRSRGKSFQAEAFKKAGSTVISAGGKQSVATANFFQRHAIYVGIDGGTHTGFAIWVPVERRFIEVSTTDFWGAIDKLLALSFNYDKQHICVVVEDPKQNKGVYIQNKTGINIGEAKKLVKIAQDVGGVKRESELLIEWLEKNGWPHIAVRPTASKQKDAAAFESLTGWTKRCSQHARDASMLVFQRGC